MTEKTPQTLVNLGIFDNPLEEAVRKYTEPLTKITMGLGNTVKYAVFKEGVEPYLLMVSQQKDRLKSSFGYNVILTVTSYSERRNQQVSEQFEKETGIDLGVVVPEQLKRLYAMMGGALKVFERNLGAAMDFMSGTLY